MSVITEDITELFPDLADLFEQDPEKCAHIVKRPSEDVGAHEHVAAAYLGQTPLEALCGYVWVPSENPDDKPICQKCVDLFNEGAR